MKLVNVLIDYDNAVINLTERSQSDVNVNLVALTYSLSSAMSTIIPDARELACRLYGGWITSDNQYTDRGKWLLAEMPNFRTRISGFRVRLSMAREVLARADMPLRGTYQNKIQKMVDGMLSADTMYLASDTESSLVIVSDDDDFVPALLASSVARPRRNPICLMRRQKAIGSACNDEILQGCNVLIGTY